MENQKVVIDWGILDKVMQYLSNRPYKEVADLIDLVNTESRMISFEKTEEKVKKS